MATPLVQPNLSSTNGGFSFGGVYKSPGAVFVTDVVVVGVVVADVVVVDVVGVLDVGVVVEDVLEVVVVDVLVVVVDAVIDALDAGVVVSLQAANNANEPTAMPPVARPATLRNSRRESLFDLPDAFLLLLPICHSKIRLNGLSHKPETYYYQEDPGNKAQGAIKFFHKLCRSAKADTKHNSYQWRGKTQGE